MLDGRLIPKNVTGPIAFPRGPRHGGRLWIAIRGAVLGHLSHCDCSIFLKCRFATPTIVSILGGGMVPRPAQTQE